MPRVVGVVFRKGCKVYDFDAGMLDLKRGDPVVVETARGVEMATVAVPPHELEEEELVQPLKPVLRRATAQDLETLAIHEELRKEALVTCRNLIEKHGLDMKLVDAEVLFGGNKIVISFFAEERVDFRALVVDLAKALRMRIELRQIGVRDEARLFGGLGPCGRHLCCTLFQVDQEPVSIRMAKEQNLPLNPLKISGLCGRLMCCLKYEQEQYLEFKKAAPRRGAVVECSLGQGVVAGHNVPKEALIIKLADGTLVEEKLGNVRVVEPVAETCGGESIDTTECMPELAELQSLQEDELELLHEEQANGDETAMLLEGLAATIYELPVEEIEPQGQEDDVFLLREQPPVVEEAPNETREKKGQKRQKRRRRPWSKKGQNGESREAGPGPRPLPTMSAGGERLPRRRVKRRGANKSDGCQEEPKALN